MRLLLILPVYFVIIYGADKCVKPYIKNGRVREKGSRHIRFNCKREYQLMGPKYAHCIRGSWDAEVPVCIKPGCNWNRYENTKGIFIDSYKGALIKVDCNPGYIAHHGNTVYCDGIRWNGTFPTCQPIFENPHKSCDFDIELCGWVDDPGIHGIKWVLGLNNAPKRDHTSAVQPKKLRTGNYMYVKKLFGSSSVSTNDDVIRFYSPVYPPSYATSELNCFSFWLFIMDTHTATLKVYVLIEGEHIDNTIPSFTSSGDTWLMWEKITITIPHTAQNFQIVIEALKFDGFVAIDDVALGTDSECQEIMPTTTEEITTDEFDSIDDFTCRNRCGMESVLVASNITADELQEAPKCDCHEKCLQSRSCCPDVFIFCPDTDTYYWNGNSNSDKTSINDIETSVSSIVTTHVMPNTLNYNTTVFPPTTSKLLTNRSFDQSFQTTYSAATTTKSPEGTIRTSKLSFVLTTTQKYTLPKLNMTKNAVQSNLTVDSKKSNKTASTTQSTTTTMSNDIPIIASNKSKIPTGSPIYEENNFIFTSKLSDQTKATNEAASSSEGIENISGVMNLDISDIIEVAAGSIVAILLIVSIVLIVMHRRRRLREQYEGTEDSEVRLIPSDEYLDFTLQKLADSEL